MNKIVSQPFEIVIRIRNLALIVFIALAVVILTLTCFEDERHSMPVYDDETASVAVSDTTCLSADAPNSEMSTALERAVVLERVQDIYQLVRNEYINHGSNYEYEWLDRAFCTKSWNDLLMAVRCKESETGRLFFEVDRWSMMREQKSYVSFENFKVDDVWFDGNQKRAVVSFEVFDNEIYTPARIELVYVDKHWMIDDFHNLRYMIDMRSSMLEYLCQEML